MTRLPLVIAVISQLSSQAFKVVYYSLRERRLAMERFVHAGGIPSAHTAFVSALSTAIAIRNGVTSDIFAVSFVFSAIIVYDAFRLRGHVQAHAEALNRMLRKQSAPVRENNSGPDDSAPLSENIGHSPMEVGIGIVWGILFALIRS